MAETIKLDPSAVATSRTEVDISAFIAAEGPDWGDAAITAYMSEGERGDTLVDYRIPNRTVVIPLRLATRGATSFDTIRRNLQAKVSLFQREGGWLSRTTSVGTLYGDVVNATLRLGGDWLQAQKSIDVNAVLTLELVPDWYGAEVSLDDIVQTTNPEIATTLKLSASTAAIAGDYPGRVRIVVDEDDADVQLGLLWGFRSRYYSSASTAALAYEAEALTPLDLAASTAVTGASGGNAVQHASLGTEWTPILSTQIVASGHMTHTGTYKVWARVRCGDTAATTIPRIRFVWGVGDLLNPTYNTPAEIVDTQRFFVADLGEIRLQSTGVGTHRWQGQWQGKADSTSSDNLQIDRVWFQPLDDGAGKLHAVPTAIPGLTSYSARSEFGTETSALTGDSLVTGGSWTLLAGGDTDDFSTGAGLGAVRTSTSDTGNFGDTSVPGVTNDKGRVIYPSTPTLTALAATLDFQLNTLVAFFVEQGLALRIVDASNYLKVVVSAQDTAGDANLSVYQVVAAAGADTDHFGHDFTMQANTHYRLRVLADTNGRLFIWFGETVEAADALPYIGAIQLDALATGGALASGKVGIFDENGSATACTRQYGSFASWAPLPDVVLPASQSAELRTEGIFREDSSGVAWVPVAHTGSLPRIPPSGLEARTVELFLKGSRGNFDEVPDNGIDDISARVHYRPSWLIAPGS